MQVAQHNVNVAMDRPVCKTICKMHFLWLLVCESQAKQSNLCIEIGELNYDAGADTVLSNLASQNGTHAVSGGTQQTQRIVDSHTLHVKM